MHPRTHRSITTDVIDWTRLRPHINVDSLDLLTYTHGLVSLLPPVNYTQATMNVIDHIYIGILPRSVHTLIRQHFSLFVTQKQRAHDRRFPPVANNTTHHERLLGSCQGKSRPFSSTQQSPPRTGQESVLPHTQDMKQGIRRSPTTSTQYLNLCGNPSIQPHTYEKWVPPKTP